MQHSKTLTSLAAVAALALGITACGSGSSQGSGSSPSASQSSSSSPSASASTSGDVDETKPHHHAPIEGASATIGAAEKGGKTYVLGGLKNEGDKPITVESASSDYASTVELHKTVNGAMSVDEKGWTIKPGETFTLSHDGYHIAVKGLKADLKKGDKIVVNLKTSAGPAHLELTVGEAASGGHHH